MQPLPMAVQRFLDGLHTGDWEGMEAHLTPDAVHDGSMPGWRLQYAGPARIVQEYRENWTGRGSWRLAEPIVTIAGDTVVAELHGSVATPEGPIVCRTANIFQLDHGRIAEHRYYCSGEWDEATVRLIEAEAPKVDGMPTPA